MRRIATTMRSGLLPGALALAMLALAGCGGSSTGPGASATAVAPSHGPAAATPGGTPGGGSPASLKDPCVLLMAADAKALLAMDYAPRANKTDSPFLSCAYTNNSGSEGLILAVSTNSLAIARIGVDGAQDLSGLGDAAFAAGGGRNAVVAWTRGGVTYKLSWNTVPTATRTAATDPVIALAHTIDARI